MIDSVPLSEMLAGTGQRGKLQQGWSPQCLTTPAPADAWGVLKTTAIQPGEFVAHENKELPAHLEPRPQLEVHPGDLLLTCAGPRSRCGVPTLVRTTRPRLMLSGKMYRFRTKPDLLDPRYLELYLLSPDAQARIEQMKTGISDSGLNLTKQRFLDLPVPVMPLAEQRRIVDILEDHLSRLDAANDYLDAVVGRARSLEQWSLNDAIWGPDETAVPVASVLREPMRNGFSARASATGSVRVLTLTAVTRRTFTDEFTKLTDASLDRVRGLWLEPGDVLVQRANTPELVGSAALYEGERDWAVFPDLLIRLRTNPAVMTPEFLSLALQSERCHRALRARAKGLAGSMPKIDQGAIANLAVPCPDVDEQRRIVAQVAARMKELERLSTAALSARRRSESLRRALLEAAFSGRLTGHASDVDRAEEMAFA